MHQYYTTGSIIFLQYSMKHKFYKHKNRTIKGKYDKVKYQSEGENTCSDSY
jgi:hypothetical protein